jgi:hypothetical protein
VNTVARLHNKDMIVCAAVPSTFTGHPNRLGAPMIPSLAQAKELRPTEQMDQFAMGAVVYEYVAGIVQARPVTVNET